MPSGSSSDADSDSDLDFLDAIQAPPPITPSPETVESIKSELWQKSGENDILRKKLESLESEHQKSVSVLLEQQSQVRNELELRINQLQLQINNEKVRTQFSAAESMISRTQLPRQTVQRTASVSASVSAADSKQKRTAELFGDGFQIKKSRVLPPSTGNTKYSNTRVSNTLPVPEVSASFSQPSYAAIDSPKGVLLSFIFSHYCFGFDECTLQLLYKVPYKESSVGQTLCNATSVDDFTLRLMNQLEFNFQNTELCVLLLSLLYEFLLRVGIEFSILESTKNVCVNSILHACSEWTTMLEPFPVFDEMDSLYLISIPNTWILVAVLYSLDTLIASQHTFSIASDLVKQLLESQSPEICRQVFDLLTNNAVCEITSPETSNELEMLIEMANIVVFRRLNEFVNTPAVLFSGPAATYLENQVTPASFFRRQKYSLHEIRLAKDPEQLAIIKEFCEEKKNSELLRIHALTLDLARGLVTKLYERYKNMDKRAFTSAQFAANRQPAPVALHFQSREERNLKTAMNSVNPANAASVNAGEENGNVINADENKALTVAQLLPKAIKDIDLFALETFVQYIDYHIVIKTEIIEKAIYYFWVRDCASLKESLNSVENDMAELFLCLSKIVYEHEQEKTRDKSNLDNSLNQIAGGESNAVEQARQLLQMLSSSFEVDKIFRVFEAP